MGFLNRLVIRRGNEGDAQRSGKSGFNEKTEILIGKEKQKNPDPHQIKIFFANSTNITTNKGSILSLLKIVISAG